MANNPYVNKVEYDGSTLIDLTADTVTPASLAQGYTAHDASGAPITGSLNTALRSDSVTPSEDEQTVTPGSGYYGLSQVTVEPIPSNYVGSGIARKSSTDLTVSGATVTAPAGYYADSASKAVASGTAGTPTATKGTVSNHSVSVTPSVTNTAGYISGSTKTGTAVTVSASELVSGSQTITENGTVDVTNLASVDVNVSGYLPISGGTLTGQLEIPDSAVADASQTPSANQYGSALYVTDQQGEQVGYVGLVHETDNDLWTQLGVTRDVNGSPAYNSMWLGLKDDGTPTVYFSGSDAQKVWQKALNVLPLSGGEMTGKIVNKFSNGAIAKNVTTGTSQLLETVAQDEGGTWFASFVQQLDASRRTRAGMVIRNMDNNGNWVQNGLNLYVAKDGTPTVSLDQPNAWCKALGYTNTDSTSGVFTKESSVTIRWFHCTKWGNVVSVSMSWYTSQAISVPANGNITDFFIGTFAAGYRQPGGETHGVSSGDSAGAAWYYINSNGQLQLGAVEGTGSARTIAANTAFDFYAAWVV